MSTDADIGVEFEHIQENWTADDAPRSKSPGRPRGRQPRGSAQPPMLGRTFSKFEAKTIIKDLAARIAAIHEGGSGDDYAEMYVELRVELLQEIVDHLQKTIDKN